MKNESRKLKIRAAVMLCMIAVITGCGAQTEGNKAIAENTADMPAEAAGQTETMRECAAAVAAAFGDVDYDAADSGAQERKDTTGAIVRKLGELGYTAVDSDNQTDMTEAQRVIRFCAAVDAGQRAELTTVSVVSPEAFRIDMFRTENGGVDILSGYYVCNGGGLAEQQSVAAYSADTWAYTEEGYLLFSGRYRTEFDSVLALSDVPVHRALRVKPLDAKFREWNRQYLRPVGYRDHNMFFTDWSEADFGALDFYDLFDRLYPLACRRPLPYTAGDDLNADVRYRIPGSVLETVLLRYFRTERQALREKLVYDSASETYLYMPRGFAETGEPDIPYPEVVDGRENDDGTLTLTVNAVWPKEDTARAFSHTVVIRPLADGGFQYVSNRMLTPGADSASYGYVPRRPVDPCGDPAENGTGAAAENGMKTETGGQTDTEESSLWLLPQPADCLFRPAEKERLERQALAAAAKTAEVYWHVDTAQGPGYASNVRNFTAGQCREVAAILGQAGYTSVTADTNMENYGALEDFYHAYMRKEETTVTVYQVNPDGLIGAMTFLHRDNAVQTYYIGIGWQEGGIPEIRHTVVSDIAEVLLTEKGYFIHTYADPMQYAGMRQYWRLRPLSDTCREMTRRYVSGVSYAGYSMLVRDWNAETVTDILEPCMFSDIYRMHTGKNLQAENGRIPAELFEALMTVYFPVSAEQLRETCGYDKAGKSYPYELAVGSQYAPFGEVTDYRENEDGTITLCVDGVWPDYGTDRAYANEIVVRPFADGTFCYLSNSVEQILDFK